MRISTSMIYEQGIASVQQQTADMLKVSQQMSTGRRILTPSDDPLAAAQVLMVSQSQATNEQYTSNASSATSALQLQESILTSVGNVLQEARLTTLQAGNPGLSLADRASLATALQHGYDELLGLANTNDGNGQYLFSGYQGSTQPFAESAPGTVVYNGDQGQRLMQISASRQIAVSSSGADVFQNNSTGNGTFATAAGTTNTGTGIISPGAVLDPAKWDTAGNSKNFTIKFDVTAGTTTYDIVDNVSGNSLLTGALAAAGPYLRTYTSGSLISLKTQAPPDTTLTPFDYGAELNVSGAPVAGDTFTVNASASQDIFTTLHNLITTLQGNGNNAAITNGNNTALSNISLAQDNILTIRARVGSSMSEVDNQSNTNSDLALQYKTTLSGLQDLDYAKAISDLTQKQASLEAAQKTFLKVQGLSLFNLM